MSKAGKGDGVDTGAIGSQHPVPENIPHLTSPNGGNGQHPPSLPTGHSQASHGSASGSPVKEASFLHRETSATTDEEKAKAEAEAKDNSAPVADVAEGQAIPIRR